MQQLAPSPSQRGLPQYGLVSLWDMLSMKADVFVSMLAACRDLRLILERKEPVQITNPKAKAALDTAATRLAHNAQLIGARTARLIALELAALVAKEKPSASAAIILLQDFEKNLERDLHGVWFHRVEDRHEPIYEGVDEKFRLVLEVYFPDADFHFVEAGKCIALGRATAAVAHVSLALESALIALAHKMEIPVAEKEPWGAVIQAIQTFMDELDRGKSPRKWASNEIKRQVHSAAKHFRNIKEAVRDRAHHRTTYKFTIEEAEHQYDDAIVFMTVVSDLSALPALWTRT